MLLLGLRYWSWYCSRLKVVGRFVVAPYSTGWRTWRGDPEQWFCTPGCRMQGADRCSSWMSACLLLPFCQHRQPRCGIGKSFLSTCSRRHRGRPACERG